MQATKAMIFAAGLGTRLHPLTVARPKALVELNGTPLLEIVIKKLIAAGVREVVINVHHFPEQIIAFLKARKDFGIHVTISHEETLLDTGGGLKKAGVFFDDGKPFIVHNVDVITGIDLGQMYRQHLERQALATLAAKPRRTSRYLVFDESGLLCGWKSLKEKRTAWARQPQGASTDLGFCGVHVISPAFLNMITEERTFSIIEPYLRLAGAGQPIMAFRVDDFYWRDVGKLEHLRQIEEEISSRSLWE